ncbi:penicillin-binding protein 1C [Donghicola sp. XS_ASV15]|uniref:penicillin-binding protein 1C n=1 Tax=Donghicola sp. XS_ASV15 TaxID=3241295 RepID=UPI003519A1E5
MRYALFVIAATLTIFAGARDRFDAWIEATILPPLVQETSVEVLDRTGKLLRAYTVEGGRWRLDASVGTVDPTYLAMLVAYEDGRFYRHNGVDLVALTRAVAQAVWYGRVVSGGSSLTMQVARLIEDSGTGRIQGKLRQMRVAWALERKLSKQQILDLYLTRAPFGGNIEGVAAATRLYFGKPPKRLTPSESALLVALPQSPETRRPDRFYESAFDARNRVIMRMGQKGVLPPEALSVARTAPLPQRRAKMPMLAAHLADLAIADQPAAQIHRTTLDGGLQSNLQELAKNAIRGHHAGLSVAILVADHRTGEVLASVGSAGYREGRGGAAYLDMTRAVRSPGSTLKPLIYGLAFDQGLAHPETIFDDRPMRFGDYAPQNFDGSFRGPLPLREALQQSLNIPAVALTDALGPAKLMSALRKAGATPVLPSGRAGLAVALGGVGLTLEDLVTLYGGLARLGRPVALHWRAGPQEQTEHRLMAPRAAWQVADILGDLTPPAGAPSGTLAYKTGTSYGHRDAWAIGFDGALVVGVWMGRPDGTPVPGAFGGDLAAPILFAAYQRATNRPVPLPPAPANTLRVAGNSLPPNLQTFIPRDGSVLPDPDAPKLVFPPSGAKLTSMPEGFFAKLQDGTPPFTWLANGAPVPANPRSRQIILPQMGEGFSRLTVIDAKGRSASTDFQITLRP